MFDLSLGKVLVIGLLALFLVGPEKLPLYAEKLGQWVRVARGMLDGAKDRMREELGPEFDDVDWAELDPRRYHPKRLIADAWNATDERSSRALEGVQEADGSDALDAAEERAAAEERVAVVAVPASR